MNLNYEIFKEFKEDIRGEFSRPIDDLVASNKEVIKTVHELVLTIKDTQKTQEMIIYQFEEQKKEYQENKEFTNTRIDKIENSNYLTWGHIVKFGVACISIGGLFIAYLSWTVDKKSHEIEAMKHEAIEREKYALSVPSPEQDKIITDLKAKLYLTEHKDTTK